MHLMSGGKKSLTMTLSCVIIRCDVGLCERVDVSGHKSVYENAHAPFHIPQSTVSTCPWI